MGGDRHLGLRPPPPDEPEVAPQPTVTLDHGVARLTFGAWFGSPHQVAPVLVAALGALPAIERLVVDVRCCGGGDSATVPHVVGHLLGPDPLLLSRIEHRDRPTEQVWSVPSPSRRLDAVPVVVVIGAGTFSGAEDIAYTLQAAGRAAVVGQVSSGGAHPVEHHAVGPGVVQIPDGRSVSAFTGGNWEGVGVVPDVVLPDGADGGEVRSGGSGGR
ncbi:hypothetical protein GCM10027446_18690 [Angustibacter peucedani]